MIAHGKLTITISDSPSLDVTIEGCETCLVAALAVLYERNQKFREIMRKAALMNTEKAILEVGKRHSN